MGAAGQSSRAWGAAVVAQRLLSFPLGTHEPRLCLGLWTKLAIPWDLEKGQARPRFGAPSPGGAEGGAGRVLGRLPGLVPRSGG